jgi:hypothetical protein
VIFSPYRTARGRAPIPEKLPGQFFVVEFDREDRSYVLHVDDEGRSTFQLGDAVEQIRALFVARGYPARIVDDMIDRAREFGACQYIPSPHEHVADRLVQLPPREAKREPLRLFEDQDNARWNSLR